DRGDRGRREAPRRRGDREMQGRAAAAARTPHHRRLCRRRLRMAELTYRDAVARGIAQEMTRDPDVIFFGEDVAKAGGVFKTTGGVLGAFGPKARGCLPVPGPGIPGRAQGAAMAGLKAVRGIMFPDFFAGVFRYIANEFAKSPFMSNRQPKCPLVVRTANGA